MSMLTETENHILNQIDIDEMIAFLKVLVQSNSENPPGNEETVAFLISEKLESFGCNVKLQYLEPGRPNIIGVIEGKAQEKLLLNGHTDTVSIGDYERWTVDPLGGEIKDGYLYGRGACDMKAGLVSMLFAMKALKTSGVPLNKGIMFTGVIDEEVSFKGTKALIREKIIDACRLGFVSEPTNLNIVTQHKGAIEYKAESIGKSAHSGQAFEGVNAIVRMGKIIAALESYNDDLACRVNHAVFRHPTVNIGTIHGGTGITFVPEHCEIEFDRQILPGEQIEKVGLEIAEIISQTERTNNFKIELTKIQQFNSWQIPESDYIVQWFKGIFEKALERKSTVGGFNGYCEVELLTRAGIPSLVFGPGDISDAHTPDERVLIQDVIDAAKVYALCGYNFVSQS